MHDDRIAGVTFEKNASRNALIVNEEYAWVGNPFSAPSKKLIIKRLSAFSFLLTDVTEALSVTQNTLKSWFVIQSVIHKIV